MGTRHARRKSGRRPFLWKGRELRCSRRYEREAERSGSRRVAGLDEVGRGALCGPVVVAAVILGEDFLCDGLDDSKRLTRRQRERLDVRIREKCLAFALGFADPGEIDRINILRATHLAMSRALSSLDPPADFLLVDGREVPGLPAPQKALVKGDCLSVSIAAASIVAKVERDRLMVAAEQSYPGYDLARNMGYGSRHHLDALRRLGPTQIHRRSFQGTTERWLF